MREVQKKQKDLGVDLEKIKTHIFKGKGSNEDFMLFSEVCKHTGLNPFLKQIYPIFRGDSLTIQTSIDGYRLIAERTGRYAPGKEPTFNYKTDKDGIEQLYSATAYVKKMTPDGTWHEVSATAFWDEYAQSFYNSKTNRKELTSFWENMPHNQLAKCAESLALRKAFPGEISIVRTEDEMENKITLIDKKKEDKTIDLLNEIEGVLERVPEYREKILRGYKVNSLKEIKPDNYESILEKLKIYEAKEIEI